MRGFLLACFLVFVLSDDGGIPDLLNPLGHRNKINPDILREDLNLENILQSPTKRFGFETPTLETIREVRNAATKLQGTTPKANWAKSGNVAQYNGFKVRPYVTIPIHLNLIFIGFEGDGHHALKLEEAQLKRWFSNLEHKMEHVRLNKDDEEATKSHVYYEYHYRVIEFDKDVNTVLEAIIWDHARPENPWSKNLDEALTYFVDVTAITDVLDTITDSLQLDESYTLFVLNPKLPHHGFRYGYRYGFSDSELIRLRSSLGLVLELQQRDPPRPLPDFPEIFLADPEDHGGVNATQKFQFKSLKSASHEWAELYMLQMHELSYWKRHPLEETPGEEPTEEKRLPPPRDMMFEVAATKLLQSHSPADKAYLNSVLHEPYATVNCLVDSWVSDKRYAFIDLSAGPFGWGPIVGGDGVKTTRSIPNIADISVALRDFSGGGLWNDTAYVHNIEKQFRKNGVQILQKEMEILSRFLDENCPGGDSTSEGEVKNCKAWRHKLATVETFLTKHKGEKTVDAKIVEQLSMIAGGPHVEAPDFLVLQGFFSKLGNIISTFQRHVVTPPSASYMGGYAQQIKFHVYVVRNHNSFRPTDPENFDFVEFQRQINELALPRQKFSYTISQHTMSDDIGLAMAYSRSLKSAVVGSLLVDGQFVSSKRLYLDSASVESHLRSLQGHLQESEPDLWHDGGVKTIPIFIFSLDFPLPVLLDKHFQAKALSDMVIAVQSDDTSWDSHVACNGRPVLWNLRNPLKAVLSATAQHLGGVFPLHFGVNPTTGKTEQEWLWSVGCSPQSYTSTNAGNFSQFTIDAIHRNYVADGLSEALKISNAAVTRLKNAKTGAGSEGVFKLIPNDKMVQQHVTVTQVLHKTGVHMRFLDFTGAIPLVHAAVRNAKHLLSNSDDVNTYLNIDHCLRGDSGKGKSSSIDWSLWIILLLAGTSVAAYLTYKPRHSKPKLI